MRRLGGIFGMMALGALLATPMAAQSSPAIWDSVEVLVPERGIDSIRSDREMFARQRGDADARAGTARLRQAEVEDQLDRLKDEIKAVDDRVNSAKKSKNEADKTVAESQKKQLERQKNVLERRRDLRTAEMEAAQAESELAAAATRALDLEYELARRRQDNATPATLADLTKKTLEAQSDWASRDENHVGKRARVADRRRSLFDAQQELVKRS